MSQSKTQSAACCTTPAIAGHDYKEKGSYTTIDGIKTYKTGPDSATKAILFITDIFGFFPQTLQGADILATGDSEQSYQVFVPDYFDGKPYPLDQFPPKTDEQKAQLGKFFEADAMPNAMELAKKIVKAAQADNSSLKEWGLVGYCWGGKVTNMMSTSGSIFKAAATAHPAAVDPEDAKNVTIPIAVLASKDEDADAVQKYSEALKVPNHVQTFGDQVHGFMAARSDLSDPNVVKAYEAGYKTVLDFFHQHL